MHHRSLRYLQDFRCQKRRKVQIPAPFAFLSDRRQVGCDRCVFRYLCSAGLLFSSATVIFSHTTPATGSSCSQPNSIFLSQHSSSSLQLQSAEHGESAPAAGKGGVELSSKALWTHTHIVARRCFTGDSIFPDTCMFTLGEVTNKARKIQ